MRSILGVSVSLSEAEVHWREFLGNLKERGIHGLEMITSDNHQGLKVALRATFNGISPGADVMSTCNAMLPHMSLACRCELKLPRIFVRF